MGYTTAKKHTMVIGFSACNPLDATEYRFLSPNDPLTVPTYENFYTNPRRITITKIYLETTAHAAYTDEAWNFVIRNIITATDLYTVAHGKAELNSYRGYIYADCEVPVTALQAIQIKTVTPNWATDPTNLSGLGYLEYIDS